MSANPFHSEALLKSASNYPVSKGDTPGHEFHGNQYTNVAMHADSSRRLMETVKSSLGGVVQHSKAADEHDKIASDMTAISKTLEDSKIGRDKVLKKAFDTAARLHEEAALMHKLAAQFENPKGSATQRAAVDATEAAYRATKKASIVADTPRHT